MYRLQENNVVYVLKFQTLFLPAILFFQHRVIFTLLNADNIFLNL